MNESIDLLRREIQIDRIELQRIIADGFINMSEKLSEHSETVAKLEARVAAVESNQQAIKRTLVGAVSATFAAMISWFFTILH